MSKVLSKDTQHIKVGAGYILRALSSLLHHTIPVMSVMLGLTVFPHILTKLNLPFGFADYHIFAKATPVWCKGDFGIAEILVLILFVSATVILLIKAERKHT